MLPLIEVSARDLLAPFQNSSQNGIKLLFSGLGSDTCIPTVVSCSKEPIATT